MSPRANRVGLWIDSKGATIVALEEDGFPRVQHLDSEVEGRFRWSGGSKSGTQPMELSDEKSHERRHQQKLRRYFAKLVRTVGDAQRILILGPGESKLGLKRALERQRRLNRTVTVRNADKMTEKQVIAAVKNHFLVSDAQLFWKRRSMP